MNKPVGAGEPSPGRADAAMAFTATPPAYLRSSLAFAIHYVRQRALLFLSLALVATAASSCSVGVQYGMKLLVDALSGSQASHSAAWWALGLFLALIAGEAVLWRSSGWLAARTTIAVGVDIRLDLLTYMTGHPIRYFQDNLAGALGHRITATAGAFGLLTNRSVWDVAPPVINFVGAIIIFAAFDIWMAVTLGLFAVAITAGLILFGIRGRPLHRAYAEQAGRVGGELIDVITNIWAIKAFSAQNRERERLTGAFTAEARAQRRSWMYTETSRVLHDVLLLIMAGTMLIWSLVLWERGAISAGDVVVVSAMTFRILHGSRDLALALVDMTQQLTYLGETLKIVGQPHAIADAPQARPFHRKEGRITFRDVTFGYTAGRPVYRRLNLEIPAGQTVGIVGPSGTGKSTLVHLVQRLHEVDEGVILIDGQPLAGITQDSLRAAIAVVPQEVSLFHRSVMENIRFARPGATDAAVTAAARAAYCHDFICNLPDGYETLVGERGTKLSGGQRQRVGIARAFLKDAPVLILDEATSALDTQSEMEVQSALSELMRDRTVLAVAHRLSTVVGLDRILVLMDGTIVEDGPPDELRRGNGIFAHMWSLQAKGLAVEEVERNETAKVSTDRGGPTLGLHA
ncbi:ATP-binding cassette, subfamily B [Faunimonas pinastri]|uniref:ATP-binding cassette, subfamily B n=1 Tax=Faunimonas pinastri TaxID=1855383 RepID=A0A1H9Q1P1_9HYPH|nr:ABC transporter ATP-binding protein [Faunimonas pinastri]SER54381.1 ATP-binding cassette, subfamily B [Faunimonas pinastri]